MARLCGACLGLLLFGAMIARGLVVDNPPDVILKRALIGLFGGMVLGLVMGRIASVVVMDNLPSHDKDASDLAAEDDATAQSASAQLEPSTGPSKAEPVSR
ncbi:MAG: hypothetical protein ACE5F9_00295 [Phycisphaerae bacterium]